MIKDKNLIYNMTTFRKTDVGEARDVIVMQKAQFNVLNLGGLGQDSACCTEKHINLHGWPFQWKAGLSIQWQVDGQQPGKTGFPTELSSLHPHNLGYSCELPTLSHTIYIFIVETKSKGTGGVEPIAKKKSYGVSLSKLTFLSKLFISSAGTASPIMLNYGS